MMVESILTMEGPVLVWNLLEMMHHMLVMHHAQLFKMLLAYLIALVGGRFPRTHPLSVMLFALRDLVASLSSAGATPESDSANSSASASPTSSPTNDRSLVSAESTQLSRTLTSLIERGWILNAEILFNHFDLRFFHLYCRVHCASCSIPPPTAIFQGIDQWHSSRVSADSPPTARRCRQQAMQRLRLKSLSKRRTACSSACLAHTGTHRRHHMPSRNFARGALRHFGSMVTISSTE